MKQKKVKEQHVSEKMLKVTKNIDSLAKILNFFKVRRNLTSAPDTNRYAAKWSNSSYAIRLSRGVTRISEVDYYETLGEFNYDANYSIISSDLYNKIHNIVARINSQFYAETNQGLDDVLTDVVTNIIQNSLTMYSMTCALFRTQTGYLVQDEDKLYLSPILLNHDWKCISNNDWIVTPGNSSFSEDIQQTDLNNQDKIMNSGQVWGCYSISNEAWGTMIADVLDNVYLTPEARRMCEHLFTTVFSDRGRNSTYSTVTFFPVSSMPCYRVVDGKFEVSMLELEGYDHLDNLDSFTQNVDNGGNFAAFEAYVNDYISSVQEQFAFFPQLHAILDELHLTNGSETNFTRDINHKAIVWVHDENPSDFVQSTATIFDGLRSTEYYYTHGQVAQYTPFTVKDEQLINTQFPQCFGGKMVEYADQIEIDLTYSFEYMLRGHVSPLRFAYFQIDNNNVFGLYRYQYLVPSTLSGGSSAQNLIIQYMNTDLYDYGAVVPLFNIGIGTLPAAGQACDEYSCVPSTRCYYNPIENAKLYNGKAWDSILDK